MIYPATPAEMAARGVDDAKLKQVLKWAKLEGFKCDGIHPELDHTLEWDTALSPGQKQVCSVSSAHAHQSFESMTTGVRLWGVCSPQRMAFARLFAHAPKVAVLDECTNGIAPDVEEDLVRKPCLAACARAFPFDVGDTASLLSPWARAVQPMPRHGNVCLLHFAQGRAPAPARLPAALQCGPSGHLRVRSHRVMQVLVAISLFVRLLRDLSCSSSSHWH